MPDDRSQPVDGPRKPRLTIIAGGAPAPKDLPGVLSADLGGAFGLVVEPNPALQRALESVRIVDEHWPPSLSKA